MSVVQRAIFFALFCCPALVESQGIHDEHNKFAYDNLERQISTNSNDSSLSLGLGVSIIVLLAIPAIVVYLMTAAESTRRADKQQGYYNRFSNSYARYDNINSYIHTTWSGKQSFMEHTLCVKDYLLNCISHQITQHMS